MSTVQAPPPPADPLNDPSRSASVRAAPKSRPGPPLSPASLGAMSQPTTPPPSEFSDKTFYTPAVTPKEVALQPHVWSRAEGESITSATDATIARNSTALKADAAEPDFGTVNESSGRGSQSSVQPFSTVAAQSNTASRTGSVANQATEKPASEQIAVAAIRVNSTQPSHNISRTGSTAKPQQESLSPIPQPTTPLPPPQPAAQHTQISQPIFVKPFGSSHGGQYISVAPVPSSSGSNFGPGTPRKEYATNASNVSRRNAGADGRKPSTSFDGSYATQPPTGGSSSSSTPTGSVAQGSSQRRELHSVKTLGNSNVNASNASADARATRMAGALVASGANASALAAPSILHYPHQPSSAQAGGGGELVTSVFLDETEAVFNEVNDMKRQLMDTNEKMQRQLFALRHQYDTVQRQLASADAQLGDQKHLEQKTNSESNNKVNQLQSQIAVLTSSLEHMRSQLKSVNKFHTKVTTVDESCNRATKASSEATKHSEIIAEMHNSWASERAMMIGRIADLERLVVGGGALVDGRHQQKVANNYATAPALHYGTPNARNVGSNSQKINSFPTATADQSSVSAHTAATTHYSSINHADPNFSRSHELSTVELIVSPEPNRMSGRGVATQYKAAQGRGVPYAMPRQPLDREFREGDDHSFFSPSEKNQVGSVKANEPTRTGSAQHAYSDADIQRQLHLVESPRRGGAAATRNDEEVNFSRQKSVALTTHNVSAVSHHTVTNDRHATATEKKPSSRSEKDKKDKHRRDRRDSATSAASSSNLSESNVVIPNSASAALRSESTFTAQSRSAIDKDSRKADSRQQSKLVSRTGTPTTQALLGASNRPTSKAAAAPSNTAGSSPTPARPPHELDVSSLPSSTGIPAPTTELIAAAIAERRREREADHQQQQLLATQEYTLQSAPTTNSADPSGLLFSTGTSRIVPADNYYLTKSRSHSDSVALGGYYPPQPQSQYGHHAYVNEGDTRSIPAPSSIASSAFRQQHQQQQQMPSHIIPQQQQALPAFPQAQQGVSSPSRGMLENVTALAIHRARQLAASPPDRGQAQPQQLQIASFQQAHQRPIQSHHQGRGRQTVIPATTAPPQEAYAGNQQRPDPYVYQEPTSDDDDRNYHQAVGQRQRPQPVYNDRYGARQQPYEFNSMQQQQQLTADASFSNRSRLGMSAPPPPPPQQQPLIYQGQPEVVVTRGGQQPAATYHTPSSRPADVSGYQQRQQVAQDQYESALPIVGYHAGSAAGSRSRQRMPLAPDVEEALRVAEMSEVAALPRPWSRVEATGGFLYQPTQYR